MELFQFLPIEHLVYLDNVCIWPIWLSYHRKARVDKTSNAYLYLAERNVFVFAEDLRHVI